MTHAKRIIIAVMSGIAAAFVIGFVSDVFGVLIGSATAAKIAGANRKIGVLVGILIVIIMLPLWLSLNLAVNLVLGIGGKVSIGWYIVILFIIGAIGGFIGSRQAKGEDRLRNLLSGRGPEPAPKDGSR
ncbi:MAG: hypothetical protein KGH60_03550 [Candidatus Micrarchaeota archaeon]|nr:hypothetical protein [Candidatus Micrarchaeota archaeon]